MENFNKYQVLAVRYPQVVHMGPHALERLGPEAKELGGRRAMVIADKGIVAAGIAQKAVDQLKASGLEVCLYSEVAPSPTLKNVNDCAASIRKQQVDLLVGVGGGSTIDVTKASAILGVHPGDIRDYLGLHQIKGKGLPKIIIPTTAGSGSEAGQAVVLKDETDDVKKVAYSRFLLADTVILDPLLTISLPRTVTVDSGLDALITAMEHFVALGSNPATDATGLEAIRLTASNLRSVYANGNDIEARYQMLLGSFLAGTASGAGLGGVHCLCYPLESVHHLTHGRANAVMALPVMEFNRPASMARFSAIAEAMGEPVDGLSLAEASKKAVSAMKEMLEDLGIKLRLRDYGIPETSLEEFADLAVTSGGRLLQNNPRTLTRDDAVALYRQAW